MADKNTIKNWFLTGLKPTQTQFWATWDSFWHKDDKIPITAIEDIENILNDKADAEALANHFTDAQAHEVLFNDKEDKTQKGVPGGYAPLNEFSKLANQYLDIVDDFTTGGSTTLASGETVKVLKTQIDAINTLLSSDNVNLDNIQELVDAIETVQMSLNSILVNDLTSGGTTKALTAEMGKILKALIDAKVSGAGTINYLPKFTGAGTIGNSRVSEDGMTMMFDSNSVFAKMFIRNSIGAILKFGFFNDYGYKFGDYLLFNEFNLGSYFRLFTPAASSVINAKTNGNLHLLENNIGRLLIGTNTDNNTDLVQVNGTILAKALKLTALPDSTGDALFTKILTAKADGTIGCEDKFENSTEYKKTVALANSFLNYLQFVLNPVFQYLDLVSSFGDSFDANNIQPISSDKWMKIVGNSTKLSVNGSSFNRNSYDVVNTSISNANSIDKFHFGIWLYVPGSSYEQPQFSSEYTSIFTDAHNIRIDARFYFELINSIDPIGVEIYGGATENHNLVLLYEYTGSVTNFIIIDDLRLQLSSDIRFIGIRIIAQATSNARVTPISFTIKPTKPLAENTVFGSIYN